MNVKKPLSQLLNIYNPKTPFNVIAHSFGSAVTTYALAKQKYKLDKIIFLTSPNSILIFLLRF